MNKKLIITTMFALVAMAGQAQTKVTGHVVNERGEKASHCACLLPLHPGIRVGSSVKVV